MSLLLHIREEGCCDKLGAILKTIFAFSIIFLCVCLLNFDVFAAPRMLYLVAIPTVGIQESYTTFDLTEAGDPSF